jgi:hypothetical protein
MLELLNSLLITILAVALVRRLLGIERGRWAVTPLILLPMSRDLGAPSQSYWRWSSPYRAPI